MSKQQNNTKKGAAAIYIVIFTATLLGIVTLSFVRLMLAESMRTTNYSLSQSAYNSALAGIEDAKVVLLRYQNCVNSGSTFAAGVECDDYVDSFDSLNSDTNAEDCDLVRHLLGYDTEYNRNNHETLIQTNTGATISSAGAAFDQAYTCVKINQKSGDYLTTLTENYPTKIVPIRTGNTSNPSDPNHVNQINRIVISWFNRKNVDKVSLDGTLDLNNYRNPQYGQNITSSNFNSFIAFSDSNTNPYYNTFGDPNNSSTLPIAPPTIQMTLIQTAEAFKLSQFYSNDGDATNRGTLTLRPVNKASGVTTIDPTHISKTSTGRNAIAASASKSQNAPIDVVCDITNEELEYACTADIVIPSPKTGYSYTRKTKIKQHYRKFDATSTFAHYLYDVEVCTGISADGKSCTSTRKLTGQQITTQGVEPQSPGTKLVATSGSRFSYSYVVCTEFNANGTCKSTSTKTMENGTASPSERINGISSLSEKPVKRYEFQICTKLTSYIACETGMMKTMSYEGTAAPQSKTALKYTRNNRTGVVSYQYCEEYNPNTGECSQYSSKVQTYTGREPSDSLRTPSSLTTTDTGKTRYAFNSCSSLKADATCSWTAMSYDGTAAPSYTVVVNKIVSNGKYNIYYCSGFKASDGSCSNWTLVTSGGRAVVYEGPADLSNSVTHVKINSKKTYYTYSYVECTGGYRDNGECKGWGTRKYSVVADTKPSEYNTIEQTQTVAASNHRNPNTTFLVLNSPYGIPETEVSVKLMHCANENSDPYNENECQTINFANVQPIIDSTGRANDLFRRVEARIELVDTYFPIANFALAADDDGSDDDNIKKDFYVTSGCSYSESYPSANSVTYVTNGTCKNAGDRSRSIAPSMNP